MIKCPLNYVGGKTKLLPQILPLFPQNINTFYDVFGGGFNVGVNVNANNLVYNDILRQVSSLIELFYKESFEKINEEIKKLEVKYDFKNLIWEQMTDEEKEYKKQSYIQLRNDYNKSLDSYELFLLICNAFSNQIRFNRKNEFNIAIGKRFYNSNIQNNLKEFCNKIKEYNCIFYSADFRDLINYLINERKFQDNDFVYLDPPYLISNACYNEKTSNNGWSIKEEMDLLNILDKLTEKKVKWALSNVLENNGLSNDILKNWSENRYNIYHLNSKYGNCNYQRTNKVNDSDEVLITNYYWR